MRSTTGRGRAKAALQDLSKHARSLCALFRVLWASRAGAVGSGQQRSERGSEARSLARSAGRKIPDSTAASRLLHFLEVLVSKLFRKSVRLPYPRGGGKEKREIRAG